MTELPALGGVLAVCPEARETRQLANSDVLAADLTSFDATGKVLGLMEDQTGLAVDCMQSGNGMLYAACLAGGTIKAAGFDRTTVMTG